VRLVMRVIVILQRVALLACTGTLPAFSRQDVPRHTLEQCWKAKQATVKIQYCSLVVLRSSNPRTLERAFNRRGLAYMEVNSVSMMHRWLTAVTMHFRRAGWLISHRTSFLLWPQPVQHGRHHFHSSPCTISMVWARGSLLMQPRSASAESTL
jgi:hypothetical protein